MWELKSLMIGMTFLNTLPRKLSQRRQSNNFLSRKDKPVSFQQNQYDKKSLRI